METFINWYELRSVSVYAQAMAKMLHEGVVVYKRSDREYYQVCRATVWPDRLMDIRTKGYGLDYACGHLPPKED